MRVSHVLLGFAVLAAPLPVSADPITLLSSTRSVVADASVAPSAPIASPVYNLPILTASMDVSTADGFATGSASLISTIDPGTGQFTGAGRTEVFHRSTNVASGGSAQSDYGFTFEVSEAQQFLFAASFATFVTDADSRALWFAELFQGPPESASSVFLFSGGDTRDLLSSGVLMPGQYRFGLSAASSSFHPGVGNSSTTFNFSLAFSDPGVAPTPEPASMLLFGTGLIGLLAGRRMQRRTRGDQEG
jgi:hypothetical protein